MKEKVILAYSGGLDTTAIIPWLKENFDYEVICVCITLYLGLRVMTLTPWVERVVLGVRAAVWKTTTRPSVEVTAISVSSVSRQAAARGDLSE